MISCVKIIPVAPEAGARVYGHMTSKEVHGIEILYVENGDVVILTPYGKNGNALAVEIQITPEAMDELTQVWLNRRPSA